MAVRDLIITNASWALLPAPEQAMWTNHYIDYAAQAGAKSGTFSDTLYTRLYELITQTSQALYLFNTGGFGVEFDGFDNVLCDDYSSTLIVDRITGDHSWHNLKTIFLRNKNATDRYHISFDSNAIGDVMFYNIFIDANGFTGSCFEIEDYDGNFKGYNIICKGDDTGSLGGLKISNSVATSGTVELENINIIGAYTGIFTVAPVASITLTNVYLQGSNESINTSGFIDGGGIITSDTRAPIVGNQNISVIAAFEDTVSFVPIPLIFISMGYYVVAFILNHN